jgi:hypothetical protein
LNLRNDNIYDWASTYFDLLLQEIVLVWTVRHTRHNQRSIWISRTKVESKLVVKCFVSLCYYYADVYCIQFAISLLFTDCLISVFLWHMVKVNFLFTSLSIQILSHQKNVKGHSDQLVVRWIFIYGNYGNFSFPYFLSGGYFP